MFSALVPVPTGAAETVTATSRSGGLDGLTVALVVNGKARATELLGYVLEELQDRFPTLTAVGPIRTDTAMLMSDAQLDDVIGRCDFVINGLGDCGSCSAGSVCVSTAFERRGIPAVPVCTSPFAPTAKAVAARQGLPEHRFVTVAHPLSSLPADELRERARDAAAQILEILGAKEPVAAHSVA